MRPTAHHVLDTVIDTFDTYVLPEVDDDYARSLGRTISQLLRSVRERVVAEPAALWDDNADLAEVLEQISPTLPEALGERVRTALTDAEATIGADTYPGVELLMARADVLRAALVDVLDGVDDAGHPARVAAREYLRRQLARQEPWLVDAWTGPRR